MKQEVTLSADLPEVHLWLTSPDDHREGRLLAEPRSPLSDAERRRAREISHDATRLGFLVGRYLVRTALSRYAKIPPDGWELAIDSHGKPYLADVHESQDLQFNLSHSGDLVVCAIARGREVGVDVEDTRRKSRTEAIAGRFFSRPEVKALSKLTEAQRHERFFELWTLKEAYIKARGVGMLPPLGSFSFDLDTPWRIGFSTRPEARDKASWHFALFAPASHHRLALAVLKREDSVLRIRSFHASRTGGFKRADVLLLRKS